jgi:hypothetical protein
MLVCKHTRESLHRVVALEELQGWITPDPLCQSSQVRRLDLSNREIFVESNLFHTSDSNLVLVEREKRPPRVIHLRLPAIEHGGARRVLVEIANVMQIVVEEG